MTVEKRRLYNTGYTGPEKAVNFMEDEDGNFHVVYIKDVHYIEEENPEEPERLMFVLQNGRQFFTLRSEKAVQQANEYIQKIKDDPEAQDLMIFGQRIPEEERE
ncbi:hypothetical protein [Paenibacillus sp. P22]|uniref:hypothetical protein n=1 Tax=Paenibacillus sp. P22 TaxID=483908 RepID=UPI0012EDA3E1|nr:hypothetical protein [Paenibacillus sp. P22]